MATASATVAAIVLATMLAMQTGIASAGEAAREGGSRAARAEPTRTVKERLGSKASDQQRVNDCNVPFDLRGPKPRPDDCSHPADRAPKR